MYTSIKNQSIEDICYEHNHIDKVLAEIKLNFELYFNSFIETKAGTVPSSSDLKKLQEKFNTHSTIKAINFSDYYKSIFSKEIENFEKDRYKYEKIFDEELLDEYKEDPGTFKSQILKNECPIIHGTLMAKNAKELDGYRRDFKRANPNLLLQIIENICKFSKEYSKNIYDCKKYENYYNYEDFKMNYLDTEDCSYYGVIGGGIKTLMLYKVYPEIFSSRSKNAIWALYYLTHKKNFDCKYDSEFLIIDTEKSITKQNYFYPYELFHYYAYEIYKLLQNKAKSLDVYINSEYRYVIVDSFLNFVTKQHEAEISELSRSIDESGAIHA